MLQKIPLCKKKELKILQQLEITLKSKKIALQNSVLIVKQLKLKIKREKEAKIIGKNLSGMFDIEFKTIIN